LNATAWALLDLNTTRPTAPSVFSPINES
jgi:hypothetical protein